MTASDTSVESLVVCSCEASVGLLTFCSFAGSALLFFFSLEMIGDVDSFSEEVDFFVLWTLGFVFLFAIRILGAFRLLVITSSSESSVSRSVTISGDLKVFPVPDVEGFLLWEFFGNSFSSAEKES